MKLPLLFLFISFILFSRAQDSIKTNLYFRTENKIFQINNNTLITYSINILNPKIYLEYFSDTSYLNFQNNVKYNGKSSAVKISSNEIYLYSLKRENDYIKVPKISNDSANYLFNYFATNNVSIDFRNDTLFEINYLRFNSYFEFIGLNKPKTLHLDHSEFMTLLNSRVAFIKDSLIKKDQQITQIYNSLKEKIEANNYEAYSDSLFLLTSDSLFSYSRFKELITEILNSHPENYLKLIEEKTKFRSNMIDPFMNSRKSKRMVKSVVGYKEGKKLFMKEYRRNRRFLIFAATTYVTFATAFYGGIIYLIVK
jgi:hypothetical protein